MYQVITPEQLTKDLHAGPSSPCALWRQVLSIIIMVAAFLLVKPSSVMAVDAADRTAAMPDSWLVLYNTNDSESVIWKNGYINLWNIPVENTLGLDVSTTEHISEAEFINSIYTPVKTHLANNPNLEDKIMGILVGYHVPGNFGTPTLSGGGGYSVSNYLVDLSLDTQAPLPRKSFNPYLQNYLSPTRFMKADLTESTYFTARIDAPSLAEAQYISVRAESISNTADPLAPDDWIYYQHYDPFAPFTTWEDLEYSIYKDSFNSTYVLPWQEFDPDTQATPNAAFRFSFYRVSGWQAMDWAGTPVGARILGYAFNSWGATTVRSTTDHNGRYVPNALFNGQYAAAIGATAEPYSNTGPLPSTLLACLAQGWSLGECMTYASKRKFWMWEVVGDPLLKIPQWFDPPRDPVDRTLTIDSPQNYDVLAADQVDITFTVENFTVGPSNTQHINIYLDQNITPYYFIADHPNTAEADGSFIAFGTLDHIGDWITDDIFRLYDLSDGSHTVRLQLVDSDNNPIWPNVETTVNFTIGINQPPVLTFIGDKQVNENELLTFPVFASDPEASPVTVTAQNLPTGANFDGAAFTWSPTFDDAGVHSITFQATDGSLTDEETVTLTVTNVNRPPELNAIGNQSGNENEFLTFPVSAFDPDASPVTVTAQNLPTGANFDGTTFTWTPTSDDMGDYLITFQATDGSLTDEETVTVTITNVNSPPEIDAIGNKSRSENEVLTFPVTATDLNNDSITITTSILPDGALFVNDVFTWTPTFEQSGQYTITFTASDGQTTGSESVVVTINNVNRAPTFQPINNIYVNTNEQIHLGLPATDPDGDSLIFSILGNLPGGSEIIDGFFHWTLQPGDSGTYPITFIAGDGELEAMSATTIYVNNNNQPPIINVVTDQWINQYATLIFPVTATDPENVPVDVTVQNLPAGATYSNDQISWTPSDGQDGTTQLIIEATDGQLITQATVTIFVMAESPDTTPPFVSYTSPSDQAIQVPLNTLLVMELADSGDGIDANNVVIQADGQDIYRGNAAQYSSAHGKTMRSGNQALYKYTFQPAQRYHNDQQIDITINAKDLNGNVMSAYTFSFSTEMMTFGGVTPVNSMDDSQDQSHPITTRDAQGNLWVAWQSGAVGSREIMVSRLLAGATAFENSVVVSAAGDPAHPAIATDTNGTVYLCWQQQRDGIWNIYAASSSDWLTWSVPLPIAQSDEHQTNPVMAVDPLNAGTVYIAYQQETANIQNIHLVSSTNGLASVNLTAVTSHSSQQIDPDMVVADGVVFIVWTDLRHPTTSIYGASSANGWLNIPIVNLPSNQWQPSLAAEDNGQTLHLVWTDDQPGHQDIFYARLSNGFADAPLTGVTVIDDTTNRKQYNPQVTATGSGSDTGVYVGWQDERNSPADSDIYFADLSAVSRTNILVTTDTTFTSQTAPALGTNAANDPYLLWVDGRGPDNDIYYGGATNNAGEQIAVTNIIRQEGGVVGTPFNNIDDVSDISVEIPAYALWSDVSLSITKVHNPILAFDTSTALPAYEFSPSSELEFARPVTITIPFATTEDISATEIALYNPRTGQFSQSGLSNIEVVKISPTLSALRFQTTHFFVIQSYLQTANPMTW